MSINSLSTTPDFVSPGLFYGGYPSANGNNTDLVYQAVKVYIEGVEIPFINISISQAMSAYPSCELEIPPHPGLMEIVRYYQPKIHIFYTDENLGGDRLLFWGHICATAYSKTRSGTGNSSIHFRCNHRVKALNDIFLSFSSPVESASQTITKPEEANLLMDRVNSAHSMAKALEGITGVVSKPGDSLSPSNKDLLTADVTKLSGDLARFENRLIGMPGALVNLWNQLKRISCFNPNTHVAMLSMFIPLFEQGLSYLKRVSGHYIVEKAQQDSRIPYCPTGQQSTDLMVPPAFRGPSFSAVQVDMAAQAVQSGTGFSGELTGFLALCEQFYDRVMYEMLILASPAEVNVDPTIPPDIDTQEKSAVEVVIKPQTPFYYSPICNVIFPRMFDTIQINQDEESIPTRVTAEHSALPNDNSGIATHYRGPGSIREAISQGLFLNKAAFTNSKNQTNIQKYDIKQTTTVDLGIPGKYEQGRGIRPLKVNLPWWLVLLSKNYDKAGSGVGKETWPVQGTPEYDDLLLHMKDWEQRYATDADGTLNQEKTGLDPHSPKTGINPHERVLFTSVDYEFSKAVARSRNGTVNCIFNPYIVPGYPMDVLDDSPHAPSFHGVCSSVTHSITASSISTSVGIVAAMTYSELSNYYNPPLHPWLDSILGMVNDTSSVTNLNEALGASFNTPTAAGEYADTSSIKNVVSTILQNPKAKEKADQFYSSVLGVGAADPSDMYDYATGQLIPQGRVSYTLVKNANGNIALPDSNGGDRNDWLTSMGNLRLVSRNIEGKESIMAKFDYKFVDVSERNYAGSTLGFSNSALESNRLLEPGASMFLDYKELEDFIVPFKAS